MSCIESTASPQRFFVTGTDTDAGKTYCSSALLRGLRLSGVHCSALKPIASGVDPDGLNPDAKALAAETGQQISLVNPLCYQLPTAPHLAAQALQQPLSLANLTELLPQSGSQLELIEGAGGWLLPLNADEYLADWVVQQQWPVVLVLHCKYPDAAHALSARNAGGPATTAAVTTIGDNAVFARGRRRRFVPAAGRTVQIATGSDRQVILIRQTDRC